MIDQPDNLWKLEGFNSYEEWLKNEKEWQARAIQNSEAFIKSSFEMFTDPEYRRILGIDVIKEKDNEND